MRVKRSRTWAEEPGRVRPVKTGKRESLRKRTQAGDKASGATLYLLPAIIHSANVIYSPQEIISTVDSLALLVLDWQAPSITRTWIEMTVPKNKELWHFWKSTERRIERLPYIRGLRPLRDIGRLCDRVWVDKLCIIRRGGEAQRAYRTCTIRASASSEGNVDVNDQLSEWAGPKQNSVRINKDEEPKIHLNPALKDSMSDSIRISFSGELEGVGDVKYGVIDGKKAHSQ